MLGKMPGSLASDRPDWSGPTAAAEHLAGKEMFQVLSTGLNILFNNQAYIPT